MQHQEIKKQPFILILVFLLCIFFVFPNTAKTSQSESPLILTEADSIKLMSVLVHLPDSQKQIYAKVNQYGSEDILRAYLFDPASSPLFLDCYQMVQMADAKHADAANENPVKTTCQILLKPHLKKDALIQLVQNKQNSFQFETTHQQTAEHLSYALRQSPHVKETAGYYLLVSTELVKKPLPRSPNHTLEHRLSLTCNKQFEAFPKCNIQVSL